jgi:hypothetical protein
MEGFLYWKDKNNVHIEPPDGTEFVSLSKYVEGKIRRSLNALYGEGEVIQFCVITEKSRDDDWAYYVSDVNTETGGLGIQLD